MSARDKLKTDDLLGTEGINRSVVQGDSPIRNSSTTSRSEDIVDNIDWNRDEEDEDTVEEK